MGRGEEVRVPRRARSPVRPIYKSEDDQMGCRGEEGIALASYGRK